MAERSRRKKTSSPPPEPDLAGQPRGDDQTIRALYELAVAGAGVLDPVALAEMTVERAGTLLGADEVWFFIWDDDANCLLPTAGWGLTPKTDLRPVRLDEGAVKEAVERRGPVVLSRTSHSRRTITAMVVAPIIVNERFIGALIARADAPHHFPPDQVQTLSLLATQVGPTIESARLYVAAERRRVEAEALAEIMAKGAVDRDPEPVIGLICQRACELTGADYAGVALTEADGSRCWRGMWGHRTDFWQRPGNFRGRGPFRESTTSGKTTVVQLGDPTAEANRDRMLTHYAEGARTIVSVPLPGMPELPGTLVLGWRTPVNPTAAQLKIAETLASYTALIVANMRARGRGRTAAREARAKAEELAASEARLRTLYEALSCGVLVKDAEGRLTHANAAAEEILGYRLDQMLGKTTDTLWQTLSDDGSILPSKERPSAMAIKSGHPCA
jgi:GAF domain-containing protein